MYVVTMTDGSTFECRSFQPDKGGLRFYAKGEKLKKYVPLHAVKAIDNKGGSGDGGNTDGGTTDGATGSAKPPSEQED